MAPLWAAGKANIGFFIPDDTPFWSRVVLFAKAAAEDVDIGIKIFDADANRVLMAKQLQQAAAEKGQFDALIFPNFISVGASGIKMCEKYQMPCFLYNSDLSEENKGRFGQPGVIYKYWIAQLIPDDKGSSANITEALLTQVEASGGQPRMVAVNGYRSDAPAIKREKGLRSVVESRSSAYFAQMVYTDWGAEEAYTRTLGLLARYPKINIVWSANYRTTTGILKALEELGKIPGEDIVVNSYDIDPDSLNHVEQGRVAVTAGGHYVEGAWSVVLAHDYLRGVRLPSGRRVLNTPMMIVSDDNLSLVKQALVQLEKKPESLSRADFSRFSIVDQPKRAKYRFSLETVLQEILLPEHN